MKRRVQNTLQQSYIPEYLLLVSSIIGTASCSVLLVLTNHPCIRITLNFDLTENTFLWRPPPAPCPEVDWTSQSDHKLHGLRAHVQAHVSCHYPWPTQPLHTRLVGKHHQLASQTVPRSEGNLGHTSVESQMSSNTSQRPKTHLSWHLQESMKLKPQLLS